MSKGAVAVRLPEESRSQVDEMCKGKEEQRAALIYPHSATYVSEHGEMAEYCASLQRSH